MTWLVNLWNLYGACFLNWLSLAVFLSCVVLICLFRRKERISNLLLWATVTVVIAIMLVEAAEYMSADFGIRILQIFSLDGSYEAVTKPVTIFASPALNMFFHFYRIVLYCVAPLLGGAVIYDVLAGVSPVLQLLFVRKRRLFVFSELNKHSIMLAEDLYRTFSECRMQQHYAILFTDSGKKEADGSLEQRARAIHAICLREDRLFHFSSSFRKSRYCTFLLMETGDRGEPDELGNVSTLQQLFKHSHSCWDRKRGCAVYIFSNNTEASKNILSVKNHFDAGTDARQSKVSVRVVRDFALTCCRHLHRHPLFEGLQEGEPVDLVLIGWTPLAQAMFKTVFWLGQMTDHPLRITIVVPPGEARPELDLQRCCPELLASCTTQDPCLRIFAGDGVVAECSAPYASLCFVEADLLAQPMQELLSAEREYQYGAAAERFRLAKARRFLLMTDGDDTNINLAIELRQALVRLQLAEEESAGRPPVIDVLVEEESAHEVVERRLEENRLDSSLPMPEVRFFGSLEQRFRWRVISLDGASLAAQEDSDPSGGSLPGRDLDVVEDSAYNNWPAIAQAYHQSTKRFCLGVQDQSGDLKESDFRQKLSPEKQSLVIALRWLEHRRLCAFLRAEGFAAPPGLDIHLVKAAKISDASLEALQSVIDEQDFSRDRIEELAEAIWNESSLKLSDWKQLSIYSHENLPAQLYPGLVECRYDSTAPEERDRLELVNVLKLLATAGKMLEKRSGR